jgi:hypothetical protein
MKKDKLYSDALFAAYSELSQLSEQEREIGIRKAQLRESVKALTPLVYGNAVDINALSLPDAMRLVFRSAGRALSANDFRTKLQDFGFDLEKYSNPLANIITAMNRMVESDEMEWVKGTATKTVTPGPNLKSLPELEPLPEPPVGLTKLIEFTEGEVVTENDKPRKIEITEEDIPF